MKKSFIRSYRRAITLLLTLAMIVVPYGINLGNVFAASQAAVEINGFQISTTIGGFRTVYSVSDPADEIASCGLVYGLEGYASEDDMVVDSSNNTVFDYMATTRGKTSVVYSSLTEAVSYVMTMRLIKQADFYNMKMFVRAYAKLIDGSIIYSDSKSTSIYSVADYLYNNGKMGTKEAHTYLYDNILTVVNSQKEVVDYDWTSSVVKPEDVTRETSATETTAETPTTTILSTTASEQETTNVNTDSSIAMPFGMVVSNPSDNTVGVVWGAGEINSYNVYIDETLVVSNVSAAYYEFYGYLKGTHTVSIATSSNGKESQRITMSVDVTGVSNVEELTTKRSIDYDNSNNEYSNPVPVLPNLEARKDKMYFKMNNSTNGQYADSQIYWCIVGKNTSGQLCYVDKEGNLVVASTALNTIPKSNRWCADICYTLEEADYVYMPETIDSGRMYISYGEQVYLTFNTASDGSIGYAGPDLNNATDPNQDVLFEFIEFTITNKEYWGNTTRVDFYSFPVVTRLIGDGGWNNYPGDANHYDRTVGDLGTREEVFEAYRKEVPDKFKSLITDKRIMAPCKLTFNEGQQYADYYDAYINAFWAKYANEDLVFDCDAGTFRGRVSGDAMIFTKEGDSGTYTIYKPTTQDVLEGKGNFNRGNSTELVIEAQLCAAMTRGVAMEPENFDNEDAFYTHSNSNFYSGFWHNHSYDGLAYGFCYDDVFDYSTLLHYTNPTGLIIDLRW